MHFSTAELRHSFQASTLDRGGAYQQRGHVLLAEQNGDVIQGQVAGSERTPYRQTIKLSRTGGKLRCSGSCSCPVGHNCKHVVAVLLDIALRAPTFPAVPFREQAPSVRPPAAAPALAPELANWLRDLRYANLAQQSGNSTASSRSSHRLLYVMMPGNGIGMAQLLLCKGKVDAGGQVVSATTVSDMYQFKMYRPDYVEEGDLLSVQLFVGMRNQSEFGSGQAPISGEIGARLIALLIEKERLYWCADKASMKKVLMPLKAGHPLQAELAWRNQEDGSERMQLALQLSTGEVLPYLVATTPPMYVHHYKIGELGLPSEMAAMSLPRWLPLLAQAPLVSMADMPAFTKALEQQGLTQLLPLPRVKAASVRRDIAPRPLLTVGSLYQPQRRDDGSYSEPWREYGLLGYDYDGHRVGVDPAEQIMRWGANGMETIMRDTAAEAAAAQTLQALGFQAARGDDATLGGVPGEVQLTSESAWFEFGMHGMATLRAQGWLIDQGPQFRFDISPIEDWYAQVDEENADSEAGQGSAWFDLELGIVVQGQRIPLLPILLQTIQQAPHDFDSAALDARSPDATLLVSLPEGQRVALPWSRVAPILRTLGELYFTDYLGSSLRLPSLDVARLAELEAGVQLRWVGGERLRQLGHKLRDFERVQPVAAPAGLQGSLRAYQADGLAWMQFLREYGLAGILADDMGLGKTIQTLSHILVEKDAGRLTAPALVVAPTSLMSNWQEEAARFAPGLRVLLLQGPQRGALLDSIPDYDLVLTSYALLPRDEAALCAYEFHLLILDESQYIKNHRAKVAQTAVLLNARHRLCLTGTPLQNHLGELWSQFHFLMPGLLGAEKAFNADFRRPIEKLGDDGRNAFLIRRVQPFLLRRTKDNVAKELPPKVEMVRHVELQGAQRDLYETVRLAMDDKVRTAIASKGAARSQIVILDALLKLRQVCCDPRLVKTDGPRKRVAAPASAKLEALMELVDELLAENRKILVFSQFTSMLALIEAELAARTVPYALLTGDTVDRAAQVGAFQRGEAPVFLISLKAGGVGLNLTAADTVIHYDPWWNPAVENQATDRAWRIGQDKTVFVYRLIARGTLEEKIQELQRRKAGLADAVLAGGDMDGLRITQDDLLSIFAGV
ncbi:MAG: DEAD/DEAH box helicase [Duganella sp.]